MARAKKVTAKTKAARKRAAEELGKQVVAELNELLATLEAGGVKAMTAKYGIPHPLRPVGPTEVKAAREALDISERAFALSVGVGVEQVRAWEAGTEPVPDIACRLIGEFAHDPAYWRVRLGFDPPTKK